MCSYQWDWGGIKIQKLVLINQIFEFQVTGWFSEYTENFNFQILSNFSIFRVHKNTEILSWVID